MAPVPRRSVRLRAETHPRDSTCPDPASPDGMIFEPDEPRPTFLIVGAAKAGTTSLYHWLKQHPDVFMPELKEPAYFVHSGIRVPTARQYASLFTAGGGVSARGEASTAYLAKPGTAGHIKEALGAVRIVILLRNPAERAYSHYKFLAMEGWEPISEFESALLAEDGRYRNRWFRCKNPGFFWDYMYFRTGFYHDQIKEYLDAFGRENVRIHLLEDLARNPGRLFRDVCEFIGVRPDFEPDLEHRNRSRMPRSVRLQFVLREIWRQTKIHDRFSRLRKLARRLIGLNMRFGREESLSEDTRRRLLRAYRRDIEKTGELMGRDLSHWLAGVEAIEAPGHTPLRPRTHPGAKLHRG